MHPHVPHHICCCLIRKCVRQGRAGHIWWQPICSSVHSQLIFRGAYRPQAITSQNRNSEACLRRLMYYLDDSGSLIISDQKFPRELYGSRRSLLNQFESVSISVSKNSNSLTGRFLRDLENLRSEIRNADTRRKVFRKSFRWVNLYSKS
jgi:hypothetical protein